MTASLSIKKHIGYIAEQIEQFRNELETVELPIEQTQFLRGQIYQCRQHQAAMEKLLKEPSTTEAAFFNEGRQ